MVYVAATKNITLHATKGKSYSSKGPYKLAAQRRKLSLCFWGERQKREGKQRLWHNVQWMSGDKSKETEPFSSKVEFQRNTCSEIQSIITSKKVINSVDHHFEKGDKFGQCMHHFEKGDKFSRSSLRKKVINSVDHHFKIGDLRRLRPCQAIGTLGTIARRWKQSRTICFSLLFPHSYLQCLGGGVQKQNLALESSVKWMNPFSQKLLLKLSLICKQDNCLSCKKRLAEQISWNCQKTGLMEGDRIYIV